MSHSSWTRRGFVSFVGGAGIGACFGRGMFADEPSSQSVAEQVGRIPRSTSGDKLNEPNWDEKLSITVGQKEGDLIGKNSKVLQAAVDYVARLGGGTVKVLPGTYMLRASIKLPGGVRLIGSGEESVLTKPASVTTKLAVDSDWYDQEITLQNSDGFEVGDSVCLRTKNPHNGGTEILKRTLVARSGNRFKLDRALRQNFWTMGEPTCSTLFPLITSEESENIAIENLTIDGNRANNANLDGNHGGCIFLQDVNNVLIKKVVARNNNGDGISWQICHDVIVEDCHSHGHAGLGLHPGSGSQRPVMRRNRIERCQIGVFFCWGVKYGLAEENTIVDIAGQGISIGHRDTHNVVRNNIVRNSGVTGILFRPERGASFCGHRNLIEGNTIENSGPKDGVAIDVQGGTEQVTIQKNSIKEVREQGERIGIRLSNESKEIKLIDNTFNGLKNTVVQL